MSKKDRRDLISRLNAAGFSTRVTSRGHLLVTRNGQLVTCFSGSPSDVRSIKNAFAPLRRLGFTL